MTVHDFEIGDIWINTRGRRVEIVASDEIQIEGVISSTVGVIAFSPVGHRAVFLRAVSDTFGWTKEAV